MKRKLSYAELSALSPCGDREPMFNGKPTLTLRQAIKAGASVSDILWVAGRLGLGQLCGDFAQNCAARSARYAASSARYAARSARYAARSASSAASSARYAASSARYAARSASSAASSARYAASSASYAASYPAEVAAQLADIIALFGDVK